MQIKEGRRLLSYLPKQMSLELNEQVSADSKMCFVLMCTRLSVCNCVCVCLCVCVCVSVSVSVCVCVSRLF